MFKHLKTYLLTGLVIVIPVAATVYIFYYVFRWINAFIQDLAPGFFAKYVPHIPFLNVIISVLIVLGIGFFASVSVGKTAINYMDKWMKRIPIVSELYFTIKQASETLLIQQKGFKRAVTLEYPRKGVYAIGFVTGDTYNEIKEAIGDKTMVNVFIPTSPNPTSGYLVFVPKSDLRDVDLTIQQAIKIVISGGFLKKEELRKGKKLSDELPI